MVRSPKKNGANPHPFQQVVETRWSSNAQPYGVSSRIMTKVIAAVYGPEASTSKVSSLQRKLAELLEEMGMKPHVVFGHLDIAQVEKELVEAPFCSLAVGWGLKEPPRWEGLFGKGFLDIPCRQLIALDLYERTRSNGLPLLHPRLNAGKYHGRRIQQGTMERFLSGIVVQVGTIYGLKWVKRQGDKNGRRRAGFTIVPGDPEEMAIVRFIFDQFVNQQLSRTQISNLLNAQCVTPPGKRRAWGHTNIGTILSNESYIGASRYRDCVKYDLFAPIVDKSLFYRAQARLNDHRHVRLATQARLMRKE